MMLLVGDKLSRLPGHSGEDGRIRYKVVAEAIKPFETVMVLYADRTGKVEWEPIDILAIVVSAYNSEKLYISGEQDEAPRNLFCGGVRAIRHPQTGEDLPLSEGMAQLFSYFDL